MCPTELKEVGKGTSYRNKDLKIKSPAFVFDNGNNSFNLKLLMDSKFLKIQRQRPPPKLFSMSSYLALSNL